jgi:hypothetical protein
MGVMGIFVAGFALLMASGGPTLLLYPGSPGR